MRLLSDGTIGGAQNFTDAVADGFPPYRAFGFITAGTIDENTRNWDVPAILTEFTSYTPSTRPRTHGTTSAAAPNADGNIEVVVTHVGEIVTATASATITGIVLTTFETKGVTFNPITAVAPANIVVEAGQTISVQHAIICELVSDF
jgi:hypothetical protein